ncbi:MAG: alpha/beta hydrolase [Myxococcota bacterium]|nr:alpha/beta hydrolase [Myxococcota bacterium]
MLNALILFTACSSASDVDGPTLQWWDDSASPTDTAKPVEDTGEPTPEPPVEPAPTTDFRSPGNQAGSTTTGTFTASGNCRLDWTWYQPTDTEVTGTVILSHGFMRNQNRMTGWGEHLSSWGIGVVTATLCHSSIFDIDSEQNARDMIALADHLDIGTRLFMGHSNGGAVSIIAAALDTQAVAVLGLDPVDARGEPAAEFVGQLSVPAYALMGESSSCNSSASGTSLFLTGSENRVLKVTESDHCDFESPSDWVCTTACNGSNRTFDDESLQATIRGLSTAFAAWMLGQDATGERWWHDGGDAFDELSSAGAISTL